jgi:hypothetical protein
MPLRIIDAGDRARAAIFCDACGKEIQTADDGNYHWRGEEEGASGGAALFFSHKRCCIAVDEAQKTQCAMELDHLVVMLALNLKVDMKKAEARARFLQDVGG